MQTLAETHKNCHEHTNTRRKTQTLSQPHKYCHKHTLCHEQSNKIKNPQTLSETHKHRHKDIMLTACCLLESIADDDDVTPMPWVLRRLKRPIRDGHTRQHSGHWNCGPSSGGGLGGMRASAVCAPLFRQNGCLQGA